MGMKSIPWWSRILLGVVLAAVLAVIVWAVKQSLSDQAADKWLIEQDKPISARLSEGSSLYQQGRYGEASVAFSGAYEMSLRADATAGQKWKADAPAPAADLSQQSINRRIRYEKATGYFKSRIAEASTGLASTIYARVLNKYRKELAAEAEGTGKRFSPPPGELEPALKAIRDGLAAMPQNTALRLLQSQILVTLGRYSDAIAILNEVMLMDSGNAEACNQLGLIYSLPVYQNSEDYKMYREKALAMFEKATMLKDMNGNDLPDPLFNLGMYYSMPPEGKPEDSLPPPEDARKAVAYLQKYLDLTKGATPQAAQVKATLARLQKVAR